MKCSSIVFAIIAGCATHAYADSIQAHHFRFGDTLETPMMEDALGKNSEFIQSQNKLLLRASYDFANDIITGTTTLSPSNFPFINDLQTLSLGGGVLIHPRIFVGINTSLHYVRLSPAYTGSTLDPTSIQFGDADVYAKWRLTPDDFKINIAFRPQFTLPTGSDEYLLSDDSYAFGGQVLLDTSFRQWKFFANAGMKYASHAQFLTINRKTTLGYGLGAFYEINSRFGLNGEWIQSVATSDVSSGQNPAQMNLGIRYSAGLTKFFVGGGIHRFKFSGNSDPFSLYAGVKLPLGAKKSTSLENTPTEDHPAVQVAPANPQFEKDLETVSNTALYFNKNSFALKKEYEETLTQVSERIISLKDQIQYVILSGYSDPRGDEAYNQILSEKRAQTVQKHLIQRGVDQNTLVTKGHGEAGSTSTNETGYSNDRRVEFQVIRK